jgi:hypothetical protein
MPTTPGLGPRGGGLLYPASNPVYDHICVYKGDITGKGNYVYLDVPSRGAPVCLYICNQARIHKYYSRVFFPLLQVIMTCRSNLSSRCGGLQGIHSCQSLFGLRVLNKRHVG